MSTRLRSHVVLSRALAARLAHAAHAACPREHCAALRDYALGRFSVFEARNPCVVASFSHM
jgi:hypothetical protein